MTQDADTSASASTGGKQHRTNWGLFSYTALALLSIALVWSLVLQTVLVNRSGRTVSSLTGALKTTQADYRQAVDTLQSEADRTRAALQEDLLVTRRQTAATIAAVGSLIRTTSNDWQDIARSAVNTIATASTQTIALLQSLLDQVQSRADAAVAAARAALVRARTLAHDAQARAADRVAAAAAAVRVALLTARAEAQRLINAVQTRLDRIQAAIDYLIAHLRPAQLDLPALHEALDRLADASRLVAAAVARQDVATKVGELLPAVRSLLDAAISRLAQAAALLARMRKPPAPGPTASPADSGAVSERERSGPHPCTPSPTTHVP